MHCRKPKGLPKHVGKRDLESKLTSIPAPIQVLQSAAAARHVGTPTGRPNPAQALSKGSRERH